ncbi:MAG: 3-dehydroquinate synthase [Bacteroidales bacterium]|nr:3-dehydroquinate synthase [Bacteroidales bacterium]
MLKELSHITDIAAILSQESELYVVYDKNVAWVADQLPAGWPRLELETSEEAKTMETVARIERWLMACGATRGSLVLAVGGGITTDMVGFAAGIYKRGVRYANFPTTLLAQVDAAIGGKTGVNLDGYKNMLGAFRMPEYTFLSADVLRTLPSRALLSGVAEMLKTFLLSDGEAYEKALRSGPTQEMIRRAAAVKEDIVARDPYERGERAKLNLGHTFGHAIEHEARMRADDITHGEAVAIGIILSAQAGEAIGLSEKGLAQRLARDFAQVGLPTQCPYPLQSLQEAMARDKKALAGGLVRFVIPVRPGEVVFHEMNPYDLHFDTK